MTPQNQANYLKSLLGNPQLKSSDLSISDVNLTDFASILTSDSDPVHLVTKLMTNDFSEAQECFENVRKIKSRKGGYSRFGWSIVQVDYLYLEAEYHSVWENSDGELFDITPDVSSSDTVFVEDSSLIYKGRSSK